MTRSSKREYLPGVPKMVTPKLAQKLLSRMLRKQPKAVVTPPPRRRAHPKCWRYSDGSSGSTGLVVAMTRGEARAAAKRALRLNPNRRLPTNVVITQES